MHRKWNGIAVPIVCATIFCLLEMQPVYAQSSRRVALLVGVNKYQKPTFSPLRYAEADVQAVGAELQQLGFDVTVLTGSAEDPEGQATHETIRRRLAELLKPLGRNDLFVLMLSGHGLQDTEGDAFYCPVDAVRSDRSTLISLSTVVDDQLAHNVGRKFVIIDACRNDADTRVRSRGIQGRVTALPEDTAMLFSCRAGQQSLESDDLRHGVFSYCLLESLRDSASTGAPVSWHTLVANVGAQMRTEKIRNLFPQEFEQEPIAASSIGHTEFSPPGLPRQVRDQLENAINQIEEGIKKSLQANEPSAGISLRRDAFEFQLVLMRALLLKQPITTDEVMARCQALIRDAKQLPESDRLRDEVDSKLTQFIINSAIVMGFVRGDDALRLIEDLLADDEYKQQIRESYVIDGYPFQTQRFAMSLDYLQQLGNSIDLAATTLAFTEQSIPLGAWNTEKWGQPPSIPIQSALAATIGTGRSQDFFLLSNRLTEAARVDPNAWKSIIETCKSMSLMRPGTHFDEFMSQAGKHDLMYSQLKQGVPCLVEFTAEWCDPCRRALKNIAELQKKYDESRLSVVIVSYDSERESTERLMDETGVKGVLFKPEADEGKEPNGWDQFAGIAFIPFTLLFDENGRLLAGTLQNVSSMIPDVEHEVISALKKIKNEAATTEIENVTPSDQPDVGQ